MGIAAWLVWRVGGFRAARLALTLFLVQLALNALWTWLFFSWHRGALAFAEILVLWVLIVATLIAFWRIRPLAGALLILYLLWVSFASALTYTVWQLNPQILGQRGEQPDTYLGRFTRIANHHCRQGASQPGNALACS